MAHITNLICVPAVTILCMHSSNERWHNIVTSSLSGWAHTQNDPCAWTYGLFVKDIYLHCKVVDIPGTDLIISMSFLRLSAVLVFDNLMHPMYQETLNPHRPAKTLMHHWIWLPCKGELGFLGGMFHETIKTWGNVDNIILVILLCLEY